MTAIVLTIASVALGLLRVAGAKSLLFQGVAHVFVGGLFGYALADEPRSRLALGLGSALTILEVACFALGKLAGFP